MSTERTTMPPRKRTKPPHSRKPKRSQRPTSTKTPVVELLVLSMAKAAAYEPTRREVCISITDPQMDPAPLSDKFAEVLRLSFSDIARPSPFAFDRLFSPDDAAAILEFVRRWSGVDRIVVHCLAGISRSPAVALALAELHGWPTADLERQYPFFNTWVWNTLVMAGQPRRRK